MKSIRISLTYSILFTVFILTTSSSTERQENQPTVFRIDAPNYTISPYTGMTREHWHQAAEYILQGAFGYIHTIDDAMKFPKQPGVSYPKSSQRFPTEKLEGLCRTLYIAMPLLKENPHLVLNGINVADYYRHHLKSIVDSTHPSFIPPRREKEGPSQNLVEFGALALSLSVIPEILWQPLDKDTRNKLAHTMLSYAEGPTVPSNWRFFNIFILSFLKEQGYNINENQLNHFIEQALNDYRGDGWYIDNSYFDYYSMWAYQMYGMVWCHFYGNKSNPDYVQKFTAHFKEMTQSYPYLFDRNGQMVMWGRSISYRFASISPFPLAGYLDDPSINYGWLRMISSTTLLQFLQHKDFLKDNVPTLGFYGAFEPAVQSYSCRGSVYWIGKAFLGLLLPEDNIFWSATENEGAWERELKAQPVNNHFHKGAQLLVTNYSTNGITEIRSCPNVARFPEWENWRVSENYNKLSYSSRFPWMADGKDGEVAMNYMVKNGQDTWAPLTNYIFSAFEDEVYYRNAFTRKYKDYTFQLADIPTPHGIIRVDKVTAPDSIEIRLGHYALPQSKDGIKEKRVKHKGKEACIIYTAENCLAAIPFHGWDKTTVIETVGLHPENKPAHVINTDYKGPGEQIFITLMFWKTNGKQFSKKELFPLKDVTISKDNKQVQLLFNDGTIKKISFE